MSPHLTCELQNFFIKFLWFIFTGRIESMNFYPFLRFRLERSEQLVKNANFNIVRDRNQTTKYKILTNVT